LDSGLLQNGDEGLDSFLQFHRFGMAMQELAMDSCESGNDKKEISWYTLILAFSPVGDC
jgi:hypothetical protein